MTNQSWTLGTACASSVVASQGAKVLRMLPIGDLCPCLQKTPATCVRISEQMRWMFLSDRPWRRYLQS